MKGLQCMRCNSDVTVKQIPMSVGEQTITIERIECPKCLTKAYFEESIIDYIAALGDLTANKTGKTKIK